MKFGENKVFGPLIKIYQNVFKVILEEKNAFMSGIRYISIMAVISTILILTIILLPLVIFNIILAIIIGVLFAVCIDTVLEAYKKYKEDI
jgi:hypothetical protein